MPKFTITVTENYTNTFDVEAEDEDQVIDLAESMAVERSFPNGHEESCNRSIAVDGLAGLGDIPVVQEQQELSNQWNAKLVQHVGSGDTFETMALGKFTPSSAQAHEVEDAHRNQQGLGAEFIVELLAAQDQNCDPKRISYYDSVDLLVQKVRSSKHWSEGEVFAYGRANDEYLVMKQIAPASCEMLTLTNHGYMDVVTAYRYTQQELTEEIFAHMGQPESELPDPRNNIGQTQQTSLASQWCAQSGRGQETGRIVALSDTEVVQDAGRQRYVAWDRKALLEHALVIGEQVTINATGAVKRHSQDKVQDLGR